MSKPYRLTDPETTLQIPFDIYGGDQAEIYLYGKNTAVTYEDVGIAEFDYLDTEEVSVPEIGEVECGRYKKDDEAGWDDITNPVEIDIDGVLYYIQVSAE